MTTVSHQGLIADCPSGLVQLWDLPLGYTDDLPTGGSNRIYAIDTPQGPLVVAVADTFNLSDADQRAIQQVLDSLELDPPG